MRTSLRAAIAITLALGALIIASVASASPPAPPEAVPAATQPPSGGTGGGGAPGTPGMTCAITNPNCNDMGFGSGGSDCPSPDPTSTDPNAPVATCVSDGTGAPTATPAIVKPTPGMANVTPTAFDTATVGGDDVTVTIAFWSGVEPCSVLDHVAIAYGTDTVTITLFQGSDPTAGQVACPDIAVLKQTTITLDQPLAGRTIVDGAVD